MDGLLRADAGNRGLVFDPRTKLCFMVTLCVFVIGGVGAGSIPWMAEVLGVVPILLLLTAGRWKRAAAYALAYFLLAGFSRFLFPLLHGPAQSISAIFCMVILRLMPGLVMGAYLLETTTVSEFIAAMGRMRIPSAITIPMAVMFRLFPTVLEEFSSINAAMREIRFGGKNAGKLVEYRLIPLLVCSVNIGNELSQAALTRGLAGDRKRTNICEIGFHMQDIALLLLALLPYGVWAASKLGVLG